jgi:hypothetical protein
LCLARCPLVDLCHQYAANFNQRWGVWGGRDRTEVREVSDDEAEKAEEDRSVAA